MASYTSIARPYARACFDYALSEGTCDAWRAALDTFAEVFRHPDVHGFIANPAVTIEQILSFLEAFLPTPWVSGLDNLVRLLAMRGKLPIMPDLAALYTMLDAAQHEQVSVEVTAAFDLDQKQVDAISEALQGVLKKRVNVQKQLDPALLGGAVIRLGDHVIDGSVRGQLERMARALVA